MTVPNEPAIDVTGCLNGYRVYVLGKPFHDFSTLTAAARVATALRTLEGYGLLGCVTGPQERVREMLAACPEVAS